MQYLFPFTQVPRDSNIIIYGAGRVGQEYLWQVNITKYVNVCCVVDEGYPDLPDLNVPMDHPRRIDVYEYDYIVVAIADFNIRQEVLKSLIQKTNALEEKIICDIIYPPNKIPVKYKTKEIYCKKMAYQFSGLPVAIHVHGGLGDMIVYKRLMDEVIKWSDAICIDVYVHPEKSLAFFKNIIHGCPFINEVVNEGEYLPELAEYAFEFEWGLDLTLLNYNKEKLAKFHKIFNMIKKIKSINKEYGQLESGKLRSIYYARCEKEGVWRYTAFNRYPGFNVIDYHTDILVNAEKNNHNLACYPNNYITINYGWGGEKKQAKVWPREYEEELIKKIHERYDELKVIQIGGQDFPKLAGCDDYVLGEDFETVKLVLKNSIIHIDCDGGMVHLAAQLGTRGIVLFGPTPINFYGYPDNINIQVGKCSNCYWLADNNYECYRKMQRPECMYNITPDIVFKKINEVLGSCEK